MVLDNIPIDLRFLIDLVNSWGITDDGFRDEKVENSSIEELSHFVTYMTSLPEKTIEQLNIWFTNEEEIHKCTDEYINYSCFFMAYEYAKAILNSRSYQN